MSYGDNWSEPARCSFCGQNRSTHDDGECEANRRAARAVSRFHEKTLPGSMPPPPIQCKQCGFHPCAPLCGFGRCSAIRETGFCGDTCKAAYQQEKDYVIRRAADGKL